jgi:PASTA domain-containing protein
VLHVSIRLKIAAVWAAGAVSLVGASPAPAATVTLGSPLTNPLPSRTIGVSATVRQTALPGATLVAPFNGQITGWKVINASGAWTLQVLHPSGGGVVSTGSTRGGTLGPGITTFPASLPIRAGDSIGLATGSPSSTLGTSDTTPGAAFAAYIPALTDNGAPRSPSNGGDRELGFNATVISNCIVPNVKGKRVKKAAKMLRTADCSKGKVKRKGGKRVTKQKPPPGTEGPPGMRVKLILGS